MEAFKPDDWPRFVRFPAFTRDWERLGLTDRDLRALEVEILKDPDRSPVIRGTGGLRKLRFVEPGAARGKSGAFRICYAVFPEFGTVALAVVFGKSEKDNLTAADRKAVSEVLRDYQAELEQESRQGQKGKSS